MNGTELSDVFMTVHIVQCIVYHRSQSQPGLLKKWTLPPTMEMENLLDEFNPIEACSKFFNEDWTINSARMTISQSAFQKAMNRCRGAMDLALRNSTKECSANEWRYFTLMSIFSSLSGMLSLLCLYLYFKIRAYITKKRGLEKETRVLRQGHTTFAAAAIGGRRRTDIMFHQEPSSKGKGERKKWMKADNEVSTPGPSWRPGMPGYPYPMPKLDLGGEETEAE